MPIVSPFDDYELPETDIWSFLFHHHHKRFSSNKVIFQDDHDNFRSYTFSDVKTASRDFGKALKTQYNIHKGDVIGVLSANDIDFPPVVYGALWAGATVSPINPGYTLTELIHQLKDSGAKMLVTQLATIKLAKNACAATGIPKSNIILMGAEGESSSRYKHWSSLHISSLHFLHQPHQPQISPKEDLAFLVYSSSTTGKPKGVPLTHYNMTSNLLQIQPTELSVLNSKGSDNHVKGIPDAPSMGDTMLTFLPFFHTFGITHNILGPTWTGVKVVVISQFRIGRWCALVQQHRATVAYIDPPIALLLSKHAIVESHDLSSLRMLISGADPISRDLIEAVYKHTGLRVKQGYGLSEAAPTAFCQPWADWKRSIGSSGNLLPNMQAKLCAIPDGHDYSRFDAKEVPQGEVGELYIRGPNVFKGYHNNEAATRESLSSDGWLRTGDLGYFDSREDLYITDRVKEFIKYKGFQIPPTELEGYLTNHELVSEAAVVGVESQILGTEIPRAHVVPEGGLEAIQDGDDKKLVQWLAGHVPDHKRLRGGIKFVDSLPKNEDGELLRRLVKNIAREEFKELEEAKMRVGYRVSANL